MSIRITILFLFVAAIGIYAWKDWFIGFCGMVLLMAFIHDEDMPTTFFGMQGLSTWNILFIAIFLAWLAYRRRQGLTWDMPRHINVLLLMYLVVILFGVLRAIFDRSHIESYPLKSLISDDFVNTVKWVLPGVLLFDACRERKHVLIAAWSCLGLYFLIASQVIFRVPWECALGGASERLILKRGKGCAEIGYNPCDISTFLAGASWGFLATLPLFRRKEYKVLILAAAGIVTFGQALTGGRAGYLAWGVTGMILCLLKWRKYLILVPVVLILLPIVFPGAAERMLTGFGETDVSGTKMTDDYTVTSGRTLIWPYVIRKIGQSPLIGYGRLGMVRSGLANQLMSELGEVFAHPHNMYLETLLDNGILGSIPIFVFWWLMLIYSIRLFRTKNCICSAIGGLSLSLIIAHLAGGIGAQHVYPRESMLGMLVVMFLSLRVYVEKGRLQTSAVHAEESWSGRLLHQQMAANFVQPDISDDNTSLIRDIR